MRSLIVILALIAPVAAKAQIPVRNQVSMAAQPLGTALQTVARQFKIELLFSSADVTGRTSRQVSGRFSAEQALVRLLTGSGLSIRRTLDGSYVVTVSSPAGLSEAEAIPDILVIGRRTQNADIRRSQNDIQPYQVVTRGEVQRSHASTVEELVGKRLSADAQAATFTQTPTASQGSVRSSIDLRGLGTDQTLVLIDGRRMPRLPTGTLAVDFLQPDVNALSPEALERVEVITSTAGGIYGPGATAGVVNLVLRRAYRGADLIVTNGITARGDAAYRRFDGRIGFTPDQGATDVMVSYSSSRSKGLSVGERDYEQRARALRLAQNPAYIGYVGDVPLSGSINIVSQGTEDLVLKPEYGGAALKSRFTSIALADGRSASALAADLLAGAGKLDLVPTPGDGGADNPILTPRSARSILANVRHRFGGGLEGYVDLIHLASEGTAVIAGASYVSIYSGPNNPFEHPIVINLPVPTLRQVLRSTTVSNRVTAGLLADLPSDWKANVDYGVGSGVQSSEVRLAGYNSYVALLSGDNAARPLNPLGDVSTLLAGLSSYPGDYTNRYRTVNLFRDGSIRLAGPLLRLPGGPLTATLLAEDRREHIPSRPLTGDYGYAINLPLPERTSAVRSYYAELRAPLFDATRGFRLLRGFELQLAVRNDASTLRAPNKVVIGDYGKEFIEVRRGATMYTAGFRVRPTQGLMVRGSIATGEIPLTVNQIGTVVNPNLFTDYPDPKRGNTPAGMDSAFTVLSEGSAAISPERARSLSFGLVLTPGRDAGLRLSIDYTRIDKRKEIVSTYSREPGYFLTHEADLPARVTRLPLTPEDAARGYTGGVVTEVDTTYLNIGRTRIDAVDATVDYLWRTEAGGDFTFHAAASWQPRYDRVMGPGLPTLDYVSTPDGALRWRGNGAIGWTKGDLGVVLSGQYYGSYSVQFSGFDFYNDRLVRDQGSARIRAQATFDLALTYRLELNRSARARSLDLRLGVQDLLDRSAPIVSDTEGGYSYYADPRRRRFELTVAVAI